MEDDGSGVDEDRAWIADRWHEVARGQRRHYDPARPVVQSSARALRRVGKERARLDVFCEGTLIARVLDREYEAGLEVVMEAIPDEHGGTGLMQLVLGTYPISVGCRCAQKRHTLDPAAVARATHARPGAPRGVRVSTVAPPSTQ